MASLTIQAENGEAIRHIIESALSKEIALLQIGMEKTKARIANFERKYNCSLQELMASGREIDDIDLVEWEGETEILRHLNDRLKQIDELEICT
ncbi:hypothetical protein HYR99_28630 [Candidatus Poribacteria bacterium]|nr:hypothetical protein [Candidatus Poribacteria bacterium]